MSKYDEALETITNPDKVHYPVRDIYQTEYETIKKVIMAFDIIKNKRVEVFWITMLIEKYGNRAIDNYNIMNLGSRQITQEEFDLLKEVLCDE